MKLLKTFALFALIFTAGTVSAQSVAAKWPTLKTYEEVITRINNGVEQGNPHVISAFTGTLNNYSQQLTTNDIPTAFKTKKIQDAVAKLQMQTQKLNELVLAKSPDATTKSLFLETYGTFQQVLSYMANLD